MNDTIRVYESPIITCYRVASLIALAFSVYVCYPIIQDYKNLRWLFIVIILAVFLAFGYTLIMWSARIQVTKEGVYRIIPIFFKKVFIPWEKIKICGCIVTGDSYLYSSDFIYLSGDYKEVNQLLKKRNYWRSLRKDMSTVFFSASRNNLVKIRNYLPKPQYENIITRLEQAGYNGNGFY